MKCVAIVCDDDDDDAGGCDDYLLKTKPTAKLKPEESISAEMWSLPYPRRRRAMRNINKLIVSRTNYGRLHAERCAFLWK